MRNSVEHTIEHGTANGRPGLTSVQNVASSSHGVYAVSQDLDEEIRDTAAPVSDSVSTDVLTIFPIARGIETIVIPQAPTILTEGGSVVTSLSVPVNTKTSVTTTSSPTPTQVSTSSNETPVTPALPQTLSQALS